jgi:hypothetical protein
MSIVQKMLAAAIQSMVVQASTQVASAAITGSSLKLDVKSITTNAVKAGVLSLANNYVDQKLNIAKDNLSNQELALQTVSHTATQTAVYGGDFKDNLVNNSLNAVGAKAFEKIGHELYSENSEYKDILPPKTVMHGLVGGAIAELKGGDFTSGAISTVTAHLVSKNMVNRYLTDVVDGKMTQEELENKVRLVSSIISAIVTKVVDPNTTDKELDISNEIGQSNVENNAVRGIGTVIKVYKKLKKIDGPITKEELKKIGLDEVADFIDDASTILDPEASLAQKAMAATDILFSTEFNNKIVRMDKNTNDFGSKSIKFDKDGNPITVDTIATGNKDWFEPNLHKRINQRGDDGFESGATTFTNKINFNNRLNPSNRKIPATGGSKTWVVPRYQADKLEKSSKKTIDIEKALGLSENQLKGGATRIDISNTSNKKLMKAKPNDAGVNSEHRPNTGLTTEGQSERIMDSIKIPNIDVKYRDLKIGD